MQRPKYTAQQIKDHLDKDDVRFAAGTSQSYTSGSKVTIAFKKFHFEESQMEYHGTIKDLNYD